MAKIPDKTGLSNLFLAGSAIYSLVKTSPSEFPFGFSAAAIGLTQGVLKFADNILEGGINERLKKTFQGIMEIVPLPLINMELYGLSRSCNCLGLAHSFFMIPLAFYLGKRLLDKEDGEDENTNTLKNMTIVGNIVSLLFLSVNEENCEYCYVAMSALAAHYGSKLVESYFEGWGETVFALGYSIVYILMGNLLY